MKNKEYYEDFLARHNGSLCSDGEPWTDFICRGHECEGCLSRLIGWLESEKDVLTGAERELIANMNGRYCYIGRDSNGELWLFENAPSLTDTDEFTNITGWAYHFPEFIANEFDEIKCGNIYNIAKC